MRIINITADDDGMLVTDDKLLGRVNENEAAKLIFDLTNWVDDQPVGTLYDVIYKLNNAFSWPVVLGAALVDNKLEYVVERLCLSEARSVYLQVNGKSVDAVYKTSALEMKIEPALVDGDAPIDPTPTWLERIEDVGNKAVVAANAQPHIGANGNWYVWNLALQLFVDSGVAATGPQGWQGPMGFTGPVGPVGPVGPTGQQGPAGPVTVEVGTVSVGAAAVTNVGTNQAARLNFVLPGASGAGVALADAAGVFPTKTAEAALQFISAVPATNKVVNGDGTSLVGWMFMGDWSTGSLVANWIRATRNTQYPYFGRAMDVVAAGHKLYYKMMVRANKAATLTMETHVSGFGSGGGISVPFPAGTAATKVSGVAVVNADSNAFSITNWAGTVAGDFIEIYKPMILDLTAIFGAGLEPSAAQMDAFFSIWPNEWFDGTVNLRRAFQALQLAMNVGIFPAKNMVVNGDLSNGTTGWAPVNGAVTAAANVLTITGSGTALSAEAQNPINIQAVPGHKIYTRAMMKVTNGVCTVMSVGIYDGVLWRDIEKAKPSAGIQYAVSGIITVNGTGSLYAHVNHQYVNAATAAGKVLNASYIMALDLTDIFGVGKEPTAAQMDAYLAFWPNSWFNGIGNLSSAMNALPALFDARTSVLPARNLIVNGNFVDATAWSLTAATLVGIASNVYTFIATAQYGGIRKSQALAAANHKYYARALIEVTSVASAIQFVCSDDTNYTLVFGYHNGSGKQALSGIVTIGDNNVTTSYITVRDARTAAWSNVSVSYMLALDLTEIFGAGKEPTKEQMDAYLSFWPNSWFDNTVNLASADKSLVAMLEARMSTRLAKNLFTNGDLSSGAVTGWNAANGSLSIASGALRHTITEVVASAMVYNGFTTVIGHVYYMACDIKPFRTHVPMAYLGGTYPSATGNKSAPAGSFTRVSFRVTATAAVNMQAFYVNGAALTEMDIGDAVDFDNMILLDLTEIFGVGKEPSAANIDVYLTYWTNSWFDGTANLTDAGKLLPALMDARKMLVIEDWVALALLQSHTGYIKYKKDAFGRVSVRVAITVGSTAAVTAMASALPVGYRPGETVRFGVRNNSTGGTPNLYIDTTGTIKCDDSMVVGHSYSGIITYEAIY